jgi:transcription initiation factor IIE alpha subunit
MAKCLCRKTTFDETSSELQTCPFCDSYYKEEPTIEHQLEAANARVKKLTEKNEKITERLKKALYSKLPGVQEVNHGS